MILNIYKPDFGFAIFLYGVSVLFLQILGFKFCCGVPLVNYGFLVSVRGLDMVLTHWRVSATANRRPKPQHRIPGYSPDCSLLPVEFAFHYYVPVFQFLSIVRTSVRTIFQFVLLAPFC